MTLALIIYLFLQFKIVGNKATRKYIWFSLISTLMLLMTEIQLLIKIYT